MTLDELRKTHSEAVTALKTKQADDIKILRESLKGKSQAGIRRAVKIKKIEQDAALKTLRTSNRAELSQFIKSQSKPLKQGEDSTGK